MLTLWRVSIPVADKNEDNDVDEDSDLPILLNNIPKNDKKKLKTVTNKVSDVFGSEPDEKTSNSSSNDHRQVMQTRLGFVFVE